MSTRINKYLSEAGFCSRREADRLVEKGRVTINDKQAEIGASVEDTDHVKVDGKSIQRKEEKIYLAFNKPVGIVSTSNSDVKNNIIDYINYPKRLIHVGRLDKDSEGLILLTTDGDIVNKILRAENNHEKEYIVTVEKPLTDEFLKAMTKGVPILDKITKPCQTKKIDAFTFKIVLTEGLNRQIRRMCKHFGYKVIKLKRIRIMNIHLDISIGKYRHLTEEEKKILFKDIKYSVSQPNG
ncbi:23S rRNA pseudouridine(2604) synthase RluF [Liberiplasma polymorphum]|uniref:23S rRNA pseudouridine(2604) synthase RluF n=1 Tax=Liberiplasma polymorphum TaxID=3374570 RepID=UPI00377538CF